MRMNDGMRDFLKYLVVALCSAIVAYLTASCTAGLVIPGYSYRTYQSHLIMLTQNQKKHKLFRKRAGIEPIIGHCKSGHRLGRNFHRSLQGDSINVVIAAAAFNFKRVLKALLTFIQKWIL